MSNLRTDCRKMMVQFSFLTMFVFFVAVMFYYEAGHIWRPHVKAQFTEKRERPGSSTPIPTFLMEYIDRSVADELARTVRVLCWVMTYPHNHQRLKDIKATWGKRCNVLLFMTTAKSRSKQIISLPIEEGEEYQWSKTKAAFRYVYEHHRDDADWFMKADDDTYVIVENLRYMLAGHDTNVPIYFGCRFKHKNHGYMSGGAGYVLSRAALDKLAEEGLAGPMHCRVYEHGQEDFEIGKCLTKIGVVAGDSRDSLRRGRFFPFRVLDHLFPNQDQEFWYWNYVYYPTKDGLDCCSEYAISFHYIQPNDMHVLDYLIYKLRPYGIAYKTGKISGILNEKSEIPTEKSDYNTKHEINKTTPGDKPATTPLPTRTHGLNNTA